MKLEAVAAARASGLGGRMTRQRRRQLVVCLLLGVALAWFFVRLRNDTPFGVDLEVYRDAAGVVAGGASLYDTPLGQLGLPFTYPPFAALIFQPLSVGPWLLPLIALWLVNVGLLFAVIRWSWMYAFPSSAQDTWQVLAVVAVCMTLLVPVRTTLVLGQVNLLLMVLVMALDMRSTRARGVGAGIAAAVKVTPSLLIVGQLVRGDVRAFLRGVAAAAACTAVAALWLPSETWSYFTRILWSTDRPGDTAFHANQSLLGAWTRLTPDLDRPLWIASSVMALALMVVAIRRHRRDPWITTTVAAMAALLVSPISWNHHWVWALPALAVGMRLRERNRWLLGSSAALATAALDWPGSVTQHASLYPILGAVWLVAMALTPAVDKTIREIVPGEGSTVATPSASIPQG